MKTSKLETTSFILHILAMVFMLCDHLWGTIIPGNNWLTCVGRISFPIFAFLIVEGYFHTSNLKKYIFRLLIFAIISEIPFNLAISSSIFYPIHQNVLWSFLLAIGLIHLNEKFANKKLLLRLIVGILSILLGSLIALLTFVDYYHAGILTVLTFYFFRKRKWWNYIGQFLCLWYINMEILEGYTYELQIFNTTIYLARQGLALLALIPIWLYQGKQGYYNKTIKYIYYLFYPIHLLILGLLKLL